MRKILIDFDLEEFDAWSQAISTKERIIEEGKQEEFNNLINELYPDGVEEVQVNDILWHDWEWVYENLGITDEEDEDEE